MAQTRDAFVQGQHGPVGGPSGTVIVFHVPLGKVHMELLDAFTHEPVTGR
jgi:hypothetical protein